MGDVDAAGLLRRLAPGAELIGWQINRGPEHEAEYVTAAQLRKHLNRPDIVAKAIQLASAEEAVRRPMARISSSPICSPGPCRACASSRPSRTPR